MTLKTPLFLIAFLVFLSLWTLKPLHSHCGEQEDYLSTIERHKDLQILSFATNANHPMLKLLIDSSPYPIEVLGLNQQWRAPRDKLEAVKQYLAKKNLRTSNKIIMFVDGYDTFFVPGKQNIIRQFKAFQKPIVLSAETGCWPYHTPICLNKAFYPKSPTKFRYVNSGTYIGYASAIYKMLKEVLEGHPQQTDDQYMLQDYFLNHQDKVALDYQQTIFSLLYQTTLKDFSYDKNTGLISNHLTHTTPIVFHGNAGPPSKALLLKLHTISHKH